MANQQKKTPSKQQTAKRWKRNQGSNMSKCSDFCAIFFLFITSAGIVYITRTDCNPSLKFSLLFFSLHSVLAPMCGRQFLCCAALQKHLSYTIYSSWLLGSLWYLFHVRFCLSRQTCFSSFWTNNNNNPNPAQWKWTRYAYGLKFIENTGFIAKKCHQNSQFVLL